MSRRLLSVAGLRAAVGAEVEKVVVGQDASVDLAVTALAVSAST